MGNIYRKQLTINDLMHPYHINIEYDNSYMMRSSDDIYEKYPSFIESSLVVNENKLAFNNDQGFYNTGTYMNPYSLIISNNSYIIGSDRNNDKETIIENSYIIYYNSYDGLYQFSYIIQEGNGLYNDETNHMMNMNIDNKSIRELNNRIYYNIESVPSSTSYKPGIHKINKNNFTINNDYSISVNHDTEINVISLKHNCKMIYMNINSLYNELNYLYEIQNSPTGLSDFQSSIVDKSTTKYEYDNQLDNNSIQKIDDEPINKLNDNQISIDDNTEFNPEIYYGSRELILDEDDYEYFIKGEIKKYTVTYQFISPKIKYSDNYYKSLKLISPNEDINIELDSSNTIYTKNIDLLDIIIDNNYTPISTYYIQAKNIASFITLNYNDDRNNFNINCTSSLRYSDNPKPNPRYCYTVNNIDLKNKVNSKKLFEKYGCTISFNLKRDYIIEGNKITYFQYSKDNLIKIIYDHRQIDNIMTINVGQSDNNTYYLFSYQLNGYYVNDKFIVNDNDKQIIFDNIKFLIKIGLAWRYDSYNLYLGYSTKYKRKYEDKDIYNKKYYKIWKYNISLKYLDYENINEFNPLLDYNEYPEIGSKSEYSFNKENNTYIHEISSNYIDNKKICLYKLTNVNNFSNFNIEQFTDLI